MKRSVALAMFVFAAGGGLVGLRWFDQHPIQFDSWPSEREIEGLAPSPTDRGDVALLFDAGTIASHGGSFAQLDLSLGWVNLLEAELGPVSRIPVDAPDPLDAYRGVVVSASSHASADVDELTRFVSNGGSLFIDAPNDGDPWNRALLDLAGVDARGSVLFPSEGLLPAGAIAVADGEAFDTIPFTRPREVSQLVAVPSDVASRAANQLSSLLMERRVGRGRVVISAVNIGRWFTSMVQGVPAGDDFGLTQRFGDYDDILEPDDLVADVKLRENEVPFADLLGRAIVATLDPVDGPPHPRLLWFPAGSDGVYLMTHDEDFRGGAKSLWLSEWDRDLGLRGTTFAIAIPRVAEDWTGERDYAAEIEALGGAVGLHWNQYPMSNGIGPIEPIEYRMSCQDQNDRLRDLSVATFDHRVNRNHYLILRDDWTRIFRILAAEGVELDSTFGANKGRGYLFGTARPYTILDRNGLPLPIRELPFVNQEDWGGADVAFFRRLFESNATHYRGSLVSIFHPHLIVLEEEGKRLFEEVARLALATGHRSWNFEEYLDFWKGRAAASIRTRLDGDDYVVTSRVERDDLWLGWPRVRGWKLVTEGPRDVVGAIDLGGVPYTTLRLASGESRVRWKRE